MVSSTGLLHESPVLTIVYEVTLFNSFFSPNIIIAITKNITSNQKKKIEMMNRKSIYVWCVRIPLILKLQSYQKERNQAVRMLILIKEGEGRLAKQPKMKMVLDQL